MEDCTIRTEADVEWVVDRVLSGDWVTAHVGGIRRPRRRGVRSADALSSLESQLTRAGAALHSACCGNSLKQLIRGRVVIAVPPEGEGGGAAGVREPRVPPPTQPSDGLAPLRAGPSDLAPDRRTFLLGAARAPRDSPGSPGFHTSDINQVRLVGRSLVGPRAIILGPKHFVSRNASGVMRVLVR